MQRKKPVSKPEINLKRRKENYNAHSSDSARQCQTTAYCLAQGAAEYEGNYCYWWLRTPGTAKRSMAVINKKGHIISGGAYVQDTYVVVRPALWIEIESKK